MSHEAHVVHQTENRFRVRIPAAKGDRARFKYLQEQLLHCPQVSAAQGNHVTGTLLVYHSGDVKGVLAYAQEQELFTVMEKGLETVARATLAAYRKLDTEIKKVSGGELDLPHLAFVGFLATGVYQVVRGRLAAPAWHSAFWYAFNIFMKTQARKRVIRAVGSPRH